MHWMGAEKTASGDPFKASLNGKIKATTRDIAFTETDVLVNASASHFEGRLDFAGVRPKLEGNIASERIDLVRLLGANKRDDVGARGCSGSRRGASGRGRLERASCRSRSP